MLEQSVILTTLFLGKHKLEHCRPYKAARHPTRCDIINDIKLFPTVYPRRYCRNFLTLSTKASALESPLKGTTTLMMTMYCMKDLNKPYILIPVSSRSVEKRRSCGHLNICKWTVMEAAIL